MKIQHTLISLSALLAALGAMPAAQAFDAQPDAQQARVSLEQARSTALQAVPGATITGEELEREDGGSGLRYSFELKTAQGEREVGIDAMTGKILERSAEAANQD